MVHIALIGAAHIHTPNFVKKIKERPDVKLKVVFDHDPARAARRAEELGAKVIEDPSAAWSDPQITAAVICSETNRHLEDVLAGAAAKKHLFVEKPLGMGSQDANAMADAVEKAGVLFQTGYFMRGNPIHRFLRDQIAKGTFGRITRMRHSNCHAGSLRGLFDAEWRWMADPKIAGCGAFGDLGTHSLDIMLWLLGEVSHVAADIDNVTARYGDCDETGEGLLRFRNGAIGTLAAAWVDQANPVSLLLSGTEAHAAVFNGQLYLHAPKIAGADGKQPWTDLPAAWPHAFDLFLDAISGKSDVPLVGVREAAYRTTVFEALYRAARERCWVAVGR